MLDTAPDGQLLLNVATVHGDQIEPVPDPNPNRATTLTRVVVPDHPVPPPPPPEPPPVPAGPPEPPAPPIPVPGPPGVLGTRLVLRKQATPSYTSAGSTVRFRLRVTNAGENTALKVTVCDTLPSGLTIASAGGLRVHGRTVCAILPRLKVLATKTLSFTVRVTGGAPRSIRNTASARAGNAPTVRAEATIHVLRPPPSGLG